MGTSTLISIASIHKSSGIFFICKHVIFSENKRNIDMLWLMEGLLEGDKSNASPGSPLCMPYNVCDPACVLEKMLSI